MRSIVKERFRPGTPEQNYWYIAFSPGPIIKQTTKGKLCFQP